MTVVLFIISLLCFPLGIALIGTALLHLLLAPLRIDKELKLAWRRNFNLNMMTFISVAMFGIGTLVLLIAYGSTIVRHFRSKKKRPVDGDLPLVPQFSLIELMIMLVSLGFLPMVAMVLIPGSNSDERTMATFIMAGFAFPLAFASAYLRMDANRVTHRALRAGFLFFYPYFVFGCAIVSAFVMFKAFAFVIVSIGKADFVSSPMEESTAPGLIAIAAMLALAPLLAWRMRKSVVDDDARIAAALSAQIRPVAEASQ